MLKNLVFLGPPGAGKGTIAALAVTKLHIPHISTGDIFRFNIKNKTALGLQVESILASGDLVPDDVTNELVKNRLQEEDVRQGFILDGFPRTIAQAEALAGFTTIDAVINFVIDETEVVRRLSGRRTCSQCGAGYHTENMKPAVEGICDKCGGELIIREDDKPEAIRDRLDVYSRKTKPLIDFYKEKNLLIDINSNQTPDLVLESLIKAVE